VPEGAAPGTVILTRDAERNAPIRWALEARAIRVIEMPCVRTEIADRSVLARAVGALTERELLVLTSRAAVAAIGAVVDPATIRAEVAAIGPATAADAGAAGMRVTFVAARAGGATLGADLPLPSGDVVLARSDRAASELPRMLRARGARVREIVAYRTVAGPTGDVRAASAAVAAGRAVVVLTSPSAVDGLLAAVPSDRARGAAIVAIGPTTAAAVRERIGAEPLVAAAPTPDAIVRAVLSAMRMEVPA
jgi:uroporphyrinogen-III synthase